MSENNLRILITGSNGQLGKCIKLISKKYFGLEVTFKDSKELDITDKRSMLSFLEAKHFDNIINCAAYTNVEQAEKEQEEAFLINAEGVKNIAEACKVNGIRLIHISTDYVFDGKKDSPYIEEDITNPINEYGKSKLLGEQYIQEILKEYFIIRTSWLYSQFGNNFYKTILEKSKTETQLNITSSEIGTPTNANDLASFILNLIGSKNQQYGIYHFSNLGKGTWYDFAKEIISLQEKDNLKKLEKTPNYPTLAKRPKYSVLDKSKTVSVFGNDILEWKESLKKLIVDLKKI
ncbi:dTDP-4-dehydrorhamnose reductase [Aquimarina sp. Aq107]|uniref:dTDP-4-dehydrorhamnose reductase n=1 Tax=Aquimarina sp. Aq107 TaxID=1191912 RepID=UPI000D55DEFB|nr:dTDP-4-dehydrorhamnose reductase [Aquimarina sp. Aq107]